MRAALSFLTVLPVGGRHAAPGRGALLAFPLAGLVLGAGWAVAGWAGTALWTPLVGAALVVALDLLVTGGLHADAVADVADGVASRRRGAEALTVMRDPRVGAVGASAAVAALLLRTAWVAALLDAGLWPALVAAPAAGRAAMVVVLARGERADGSSLAAALGRAATPGVAGLALGCAAATGAATAACAAALAGASPTTGALAGLAAAAAAAVLGVAGEAVWRRRFGALTGDAAGATGAAAELAALAVLALLASGASG